MTRPATIVKFDKVTKVYTRGVWRPSPLCALDAVSFSILAGETFGVVGPNRAGKTTLVKILLSLCRPTEGRVLRLGAPLSDRRTLAQVGYVHERQAFPGYLTARELLHYYGAMSCLPAAEVRRRSDELLETVGLADRCREPISRFSKGMVQRLALAQALLNDPELLVLDEPSEGMDLVARRLLRGIVQERRGRGQTTLIVSHALSDIGRACDRIAVLREGRLTYLGPVRELTETGQNGEPHRSLEEALEPLYEGACP